MHTKALPHLHSLWVGPKLNYLERMCIASARAAGHDFTLWSYDPGALEGVPPNIDLRDAAEVMPQERLLRYRDSGSVALGANLWRIELLAKGLGCWIDTDILVMRAIDFDTPYLFGFEYEGTINNAVLGAPAGSQMVEDLQRLARPNRRPPWFGPKRSMLYYYRRLREGPLGLEDLPWGTYGPGMLTYVLRKHGLLPKAQTPDVFYPVRWRDARALYEPAEVVHGMLSAETRCIHLYHSQLRELKDAPPPKGSFIAEMCQRLDVSP